MLSAANDILKKITVNTTLEHYDSFEETHQHKLDCNPIGTGAILLADVLPTLFIKTLAPSFIQKISYKVKIIFIGLAALVSFIVVALSKALWMSILGVICASISSGVGEITFLALAASYEKSSLQGWSSGTGAAGLVGSLVYLGLTMVVSPRTTLFVCMGVPLLLILCYFLLLPLSQSQRMVNDHSSSLLNQNDAYDTDSMSSDDSGDNDPTQTEQVEPTIGEKLQLIGPMLEFMVPLSLVYFFEYVINQTFMELLFFPNAFITHREQYRWYQTIYQLGVLISRSSLFFFSFRHIWLMAVLQGINLVLLLCQIIFFFIPSIWIVFIVILYEGLLGGLAYVNTFYFILKLPLPQFAEYRMGVASVGDSFGITIAGAVSIPLHNMLCQNF